MKKIFKSLSLSIVMAFTMSITPLLSSFDGSDVSFIEAASKQTFKTFTVNSVYSSSTKITGKGTKGASVKAYVNGTQIGKSSVSSSGTYSIKISKNKITIKIIKSGYATKSKTITVKASPSSSSGSSSSSKYVYANGGKYTSNIYHKTPKAHNMEGAIKMTVSQAKAKGYRACKRCW